MEIILKDVVKKYKNTVAADGISLEIEKGDVYGIIGPNGAGKTTIMEIMLGLRKQDSGSVTIKGMDNVRDHKRLVYTVGAQLQQSELPANIKVREALALQAGIFGVKPDIDSLLADFNLSDKAGAYCSKLSGGQKQRLFILLAVIHDPEIVFFDELSTGLDPVSRQDVWNYVRKLSERGKTIIVSTHYMHEAEEICGHVALINKGRVVDTGTPRQLMEKLPFSRVISFESSAGHQRIRQALEKVRGFVDTELMPDGKYRVFADDAFAVDDMGRGLLPDIRGLQMRESSFEDYFYYKVRVKG